MAALLVKDLTTNPLRAQEDAHEHCIKWLEIELLNIAAINNGRGQVARVTILWEEEEES